MMDAPDDTAGSLLEQIRAAPDDDAPRLVYADWLLGRGDSQGELIQVQCELARLAVEGVDSPRRKHLASRQRALLAEHKGRWAALSQYGRCEVRRGFVAHARLPVAVFLARADEFFRVAPMLESIRFEFVEQSNLILQQYRDLIASPYIQRLRALQLPWTSVEAVEIAELLAGAPALAGLRALELASIYIWGTAAQVNEASYAIALDRLGRGPHLDGLRRLRLVRTHVGTEGARALARARFRLEELSSSGGACGVGDDGVRALAESPAMDELQVLALDQAAVETPGAVAIAKSPHLARLVSLDLSRSRINFEGAAAIGASPTLANLRSLELRQNRIGRKGGVALAEGGQLARLSSLGLRGAGIGDTGVGALVESRFAPSLRNLDLRANQITDSGADRLAAAATLAALEQLRLDNNRISDEGQARLALSPTLRGTRIVIAGQPLRRKEAAAKAKKLTIIDGR